MYEKSNKTKTENFQRKQDYPKPKVVINCINYKEIYNKNRMQNIKTTNKIMSIINPFDSKTICTTNCYEKF